MKVRELDLYWVGEQGFYSLDVGVKVWYIFGEGEVKVVPLHYGDFSGGFGSFVYEKDFEVTSCQESGWFKWCGEVELEVVMECFDYCPTA